MEGALNHKVKKGCTFFLSLFLISVLKLLVCFNWVPQYQNFYMTCRILSEFEVAISDFPNWRLLLLAQQSLFLRLKLRGKFKECIWLVCLLDVTRLVKCQTANSVPALSPSSCSPPSCCLASNNNNNKGS